MQTSLLLYDIPETSRYPNPSGRLRRRALRINLSCWVVDRARTPWQLLDQMTAAGVHWHLIEFSEGATADILKLAADTMRRELTENAAREAASLERIDNERDAVLNDPAATARMRRIAEQTHSRKRANVLGRTEKLVADLEEAAKVFGMDLANLPFQGCRSRVNAVRALNGARASAYTSVAAQLGQVATLDPALQAAANAADLPAEIMADVAEEAGIEANTLRTTFMAAHEGAVTNGETSAVHTSGAPAAREQRAPLAMRGTAGPQQFSARTRTGMRRVTSTFTDMEAARVLRGSTDNFASELSARVLRRHRISPRQRAWLHILAVENAPRHGSDEAALASDRTVHQVEEAQEQRGMEAHEQVPTPTVDSTAFEWDAEAVRLTADASFLGWRAGFFPETVVVRSVKTGNLRTFTVVARHTATGDLTHVSYRSHDGVELWVIND